MKVGIVDIGSNSVRTMTAALKDGAIVCSDKQVYTTRLAEGLFATGMLSDARMDESLSVIRRFFDDLSPADIPVYAYATSAVRDATNRAVFVARVCDIIGDRLAVLSGEEEARYAFLAATGGEGGMIDIGGGSTQLVTVGSAVSVPLGCVRAKDICGSAVALADLKRTLRPVFESAFPLTKFTGIPVWSGVGGTITTLAAYALGCRAYDRHTVSNAVLSRQALCCALRELDRISPAERADIPLLRRRYDVILHGGAILLYLMENLAIDRLRVSDTDGMEGYAAQVLAAQI